MVLTQRPGDREQNSYSKGLSRSLGPKQKRSLLFVGVGELGFHWGAAGWTRRTTGRTIEGTVRGLYRWVNRRGYLILLTWVKLNEAILYLNSVHFAIPSKFFKCMNFKRADCVHCHPGSYGSWSHFGGRNLPFHVVTGMMPWVMQRSPCAGAEGYSRREVVLRLFNEGSSTRSRAKAED